MNNFNIETNEIAIFYSLRSLSVISAPRASCSVQAFDALGRRCSLADVKSYAKQNKFSSRSFNFIDFMKAYAVIFFDDDNDDGDSDSSSSSTSSSTSTHLKFSKLHTTSNAFINDEAADLQKWAEVLGDKQLFKLEKIFDEHATPLRRADGSTSSRVGLRVRELRTALRDLSRDVSPQTLSSFLSEAQLKPGDALSLADFAYAFHSLFGDGGVDNLYR